MKNSLRRAKLRAKARSEREQKQKKKEKEKEKEEERKAELQIKLHKEYATAYNQMVKSVLRRYAKSAWTEWLVYYTWSGLEPCWILQGTLLRTNKFSVVAVTLRFRRKKPYQFEIRAEHTVEIPVRRAKDDLLEAVEKSLG